MKKKSGGFFNPIDPRVNFPLLEKDLLEYWEKNGVVEKYLNKNKDEAQSFSFLDGPITANNPMGVHHAWGRTYKDLWQRYYNLKGFKQRFQNGFDCQGLWVEVEVEKELGIKTKRDIENLVPGDKKASIKKFVDLCKERVKKYSDIQTEQSKTLGYFMDWDNSYFTLSENNNYMIWHFLKVCHENGWIYKGSDVVPWCPRCETAISQHEILTEDYKDVTHKSIYFALPIDGEKDTYLLVWTTTPWTIPANTAVSVDKNLDYALVDSGGKKYWVANDLVKNIFGPGAVIAKTQKGSDLVGLTYLSPSDSLEVVSKALAEYKNMHKVVATDNMIMPISTEEGTGLVHTSTSTGEEDHKLGVKLGLPTVPAIDDSANYLEGYGVLSGRNAKDNPEIIFDYLKNSSENWIYKITPYKHRYPACWRCKSELVWKLTDEWYISMDKPSKLSSKDDNNSLTLRERMMHVVKDITWVPSFGLERELDWLKNMHDWLISKKNRYWGLALPIWECTKCNSFDVIGSREELEKKAVSGWEKFKGKTPHKPQIDEVKIECSKCGGISERIEPVGNPWLDAGIVVYSTISENNKACLFGASSEDPLYLKDRNVWKKWFPADFITESFPGQFKNWFYSLIAMSTVLEDTAPFKKVLGFATLLSENGKPMHKSSGNFIEFNEGAEKIGVDVMRWMFLRQNPADNLLFGYKIADDVRRSFHLKLWNVYNFFVSYANLDGYEPPKNLAVPDFDDLSALDKWILARFADLVFSVEKNLEKISPNKASAFFEEFVDDLSNWYIRRSRDRVGPQNDNQLDRQHFYDTLYYILVNFSTILSPLLPYISDSIYRNLTGKVSVHLENWPSIDIEYKDQNLKKLILQMKKVREYVELVHAERKKVQIPVKQPLSRVEIITPASFEIAEEILKVAQDELNIKSIVFKKGKAQKIVLDTKITMELKEEAMARDLIRKIQEERKKMNLSLTQETKVENDWVPKNKKLVQKIILKTYSRELIVGDTFKVKVIS